MRWGGCYGSILKFGAGQLHQQHAGTLFYHRQALCVKG